MSSLRLAKKSKVSQVSVSPSHPLSVCLSTGSYGEL
jgi:hypothetical protein